VRVAIVACRSGRGAARDDLYPDDDWPLLQAALEVVGVDAARLAWDDDEVDWHSFDVVVIRSSWDSVDRPVEFLAWSRATSQATTLMNPLAALEWNLDKAYLSDLHVSGVPVVPTEWVTDASQWTVPSYEFVVKPSVSGGGRETARYEPDEGGAGRLHLRRLLKTGRAVMVQPYVQSVDVEGEAKLVYLNGEFSHAARVGALLEVGEGVLERPWEKPVSVDETSPTPAQLDVGERALAAAQATVGRSTLYARVDLVTAPTGDPWLAELELVDPSLLLRVDPTGAERLARAIQTQAQPNTHAD
jgi:hypothetical protein